MKAPPIPILDLDMKAFSSSSSSSSTTVPSSSSSSSSSPSQAIKKQRERDRDTWVTMIDEASGDPYLYNDVTGETKWPDGSPSPHLKKQLSYGFDRNEEFVGGGNIDNFVSNASEWTRQIDVNTGDIYLYNEKSGETKWPSPSPKKPRPPSTPSSEKLKKEGTWKKIVDEESGEIYMYNEETEETKWPSPSPSKKSLLSQTSDNGRGNGGSEGMWNKFIDEETGETYMYNEQTGETKWPSPLRRPQSASKLRSSIASVEAKDETETEWVRFTDNEGFEYFYNERTGESRWTADADADISTNPPGSGQGKSEEDEDQIRAGEVKSIIADEEKSVSDKISPPPLTPSKQWDSSIDPDTQTNYYYNVTTGESQWETPLPLKGKKVRIDTKTNEGDDPESITKNPPSPDKNAVGSPYLMRSLSNVSASSTSSISTKSPSKVNFSPNSRKSPSRDAPGSPFVRKDSVWLTKQKQRLRHDEDVFKDEDDDDEENENEDRSKVVKFGNNELVQNPPSVAESSDNFNMIADKEALADFMESEDEKALKKFEKLKIGALKMRIGQGDGCSWIEWQAANDGPTFYSVHAEKGGQWAKPAVFINEDSSESGTGNVSVLNTKVKYIQDNEEQGNEKYTGSQYNSSSSHSLLNKKKSEEKPYLASSSSSKPKPSRSNGIAAKVEEMKEAYKQVRASDIEAEVAIEYRELQQRTEQAKFRWQKFVSNDSAASDKEIDEDKIHENRGYANRKDARMEEEESDSIERELLRRGNERTLGDRRDNKNTNHRNKNDFISSTKFDMYSDENNDDNDDDDDDDDYLNNGVSERKQSSNFQIRKGGNSATSSKMSDDTDFNILFARSVVVKQVWPWTCLADMKSDKLFYRNDVENKFQLDPPPNFFTTGPSEEDEEEEDESEWGRSSKPKKKTIPDLVQLGESALGLVDRFKDELQIRRRIVAKDRSLQFVVSTSTIEERNRKLTRNGTDSSSSKAYDEAASLVAKIRNYSIVASDNTTPKKPSNNNSIFSAKRASNRDFTVEYSPPEGIDVDSLRAIHESAKHNPLAYSAFASPKKKMKPPVFPSSPSPPISHSHSHNNEVKHSASNDMEDDVILLDRIRRIVKTIPMPDVLKATFTGGASSPTTAPTPAETVSESRFQSPSANRSKAIGGKGKGKKPDIMDKSLLQKEKVVNDFNLQNNAIREIVERMMDISDEGGDNLTWLEKEMFRRYILETMVTQRSQLVMPMNLREAKAHPTVPINVACPNAIPISSIRKMCRSNYEVRNLRKWQVYSDPKGNLETLFVLSKSGIVQTGEPFDFIAHRLRRSLVRQDWKDFYRRFHSQKEYNHLANLELLTDVDGGMLYYCPHRDAYSCNGRFDSGMNVELYSEEKSPKSKKSPSKKGKTDNFDFAYIPPPQKYKHSPSTSIQTRKGINPSGTERNVWLKIPPLRTFVTDAWGTARMSFDPSSTGSRRNAYGVSSNSPIPILIPASPMSVERGRAALSPAVSSKPHLLQQQLSQKDTIEDFEALLGTVVDASNALENNHNKKINNMNMKISVNVNNFADETAVMESKVRDDIVSLSFERCLNDSAFEEYKKFILQLSKNPTSVLVLMELSLWLLLQGLGPEAYSLVVRANEVMSQSKQTYTDHAICKLLEIKLANRYKGLYPSIKKTKRLIQLCPETPLVLAQCAINLHKLQFFKQSEQVFVGALILQPLCVSALRGYANLLAERGNFNAAARYTARVDDDSLAGLIAHTEYAWLHELIGADSDAILLAYRGCLTKGMSGRASSLALHSLGHFYHVRGDTPKALELYRRALMYDPDNPYAYLLMSCITDPGLMTPASADAGFRKGLFFLKSPHRWMALFAHAEAIIANMRDLTRGELLLREAVMLSLPISVWPSIALAQYLQYARGQPEKGRRYLRRLLHKRSILMNPSAALASASSSIKKSLGIQIEDAESEGDESEDEEGELGDDGDWIKKSSPQPAADGVGPRKRLDDGTADEEITAVFVALAYNCWDEGNDNEAARYASIALKRDSTISPAHRLLGLLGWYRQHGKREAMRHFESSIRFGATNPYTLRTVAIVQALQASYASALSTMTAAVDCGSNCPLAWRALGIMSYLFEGAAASSEGNMHKEHAVACLANAYKLSGGIGREGQARSGLDAESVRLQGQILMELGRAAEARVCFQQSLAIQPSDPITLSCLAMSLYSLGYKSPPHAPIDYDDRFASLSTFYALINSEDPEELFQAAIFISLGGGKKAKNYFAEEKQQGEGEGNNFGEDAESEMQGEDDDAQSDVLYWYGMSHLQKGTTKGLAKAKDLLTRAVQRRDSTPHPLALYMLGWIEELYGCLVSAERHYCIALQAEPIDPLGFLRLVQLAKDTQTYVKGLTKECERGGSGSSGGTSSKGKKKSGKAKKLKSKKKKISIFSNQFFQDGDEDDEDNGGNDDDDAIHPTLPTPLTAPKKIKVPTAQDMKKRLLLHDRVARLAKLRFANVKKSVSGLRTPGKMVYIDPFWLERLLHAFGVCDDWSTLLQGSRAAAK